MCPRLSSDQKIRPMFEHPRFDRYDFEQIPLNQDVFIVGQEWMQPYEEMMLRFFDGVDGAQYETVGFISWSEALNISANAVELSWLVDYTTRLHNVSVSLPRSEFVACVGCWSASERPRIFVTDKWLSHIHLRNYSVFGLIDVIGIKARIEDGSLSPELLLKLRSRTDDIASQHPDVTFISFGDSLLLKSNWTVGVFDSGVTYTYAPEKLMAVFQDVSDMYREVLGMNIYGVFTQGANDFFGSTSVHISKSGNHLSMNCLGVPFERLFAIDEAARRAIRASHHKPSEIYLDEEYFRSLQLPFSFRSSKEVSQGLRMNIESIERFAKEGTAAGAKQSLAFDGYLGGF
jgi:hypothetical protein